MNDYFEFNGHYYSINMDKYMDFISETKNSEKDNSTVITQVFSDGDNEYERPNNEQILPPFKVVSKEITENKNNTNPIFNNIRYDLLKTLLTTLISPYYNQDGSFIMFNSEEDLLLGQKIAFNTLLNKGIIFEIN